MIFKRFSKLAIAAATMGAMVLAAGCGGQSATGDAKKMEVVASVFPVYDVAKQVGGDKVQVTLLVPPTSEPHDWEPKPADLAKIGKAKVFLYNGLGLEPTEKLLTKDVLKEAKPIELGKTVEVLPMAAHEEDEEHEHEHGHEHEDGHKHEGEHKEEATHEHEHEHHHEGGVDPHVWLSPVNVIKEAEAVAKAFGEADPANKAYYEANAKAYIEKLQALDKEYTDFTKTLSNKNLVVSHEAFGYMAHRYGLTQLGIMGVSPNAEPTPDRMAKIVDFVKDHQVKAIFSETLVNPKLAEAIAKEAGVKVYVLNPVEGLTPEQEKEGKTYLDLMKENLATLKKALS